MSKLHRYVKNSSTRVYPRQVLAPLCRLGWLCLLLTLFLPVAVQAQSPVIRVEGGVGALRENIRAHLNVDERCNAPLRRLNRQIPQIRRTVERAAQALGYYQLNQQVEFTVTEECWELYVGVQVGPPVRIGEITIYIDPAADLSVFEPVLSELPVRRGDQLNHNQYERLKSSISSAAVEHGYFSARFTRSELAIDLDANTAGIHIEFEPGPRYNFGEIRITPVDALANTFISRFVPFEPSEPYSTEMLATLRQNLNDSQYFSQVAVTPLLSQAQDQEIPVVIELTPRARRSYSTGIGASTDVGPRVRFGYEDRYINRRGHRLNAALALSLQEQEPTVSYVIPLRDPSTESLRFSAGFLRQQTDSYLTNTYRIGTTFRSNVWGNWIQNIFINYQHEVAELNRIRSTSDSTISGINWARTRSDDPIYPSRGWRLFGQISGAHDTLLSDISFVQLYGSGKLVYSVGPGRVLLRNEVATTFVSEVQELPVSIRFFTGGDQSVRGYQYGALGARNAEGNVVGGGNLLVSSIEYDYTFRPNWNAAIFYDVGNSFADFGNMQLKRGLGMGIRWISPIGAIRLDVARGLDDGSYRFHITMGPDL